MFPLALRLSLLVPGSCYKRRQNAQSAVLVYHLHIPNALGKAPIDGESSGRANKVPSDLALDKSSSLTSYPVIIQEAGNKHSYYPPSARLLAIDSSSNCWGIGRSLLREAHEQTVHQTLIGSR